MYVSRWALYTTSSAVTSTVTSLYSVNFLYFVSKQQCQANKYISVRLVDVEKRSIFQYVFIILFLMKYWKRLTVPDVGLERQRRNWKCLFLPNIENSCKGLSNRKARANKFISLEYIIQIQDVQGRDCYAKVPSCDRMSQLS